MESTANTGKLYLIPSLMGEVEPLEVLPLAIRKVIDITDHYIVESEKSARAFIKRVHPPKNQDKLEIYTINKYTDAADIPGFLEPCLQGRHVGLLSEAGAPGIADPGSDLIRMAHDKNIRVVPLVGPSSIFMGMMASGLNGQSFAFNGYLPIDKKERIREIKRLEKECLKSGQSQIFMETPYRNQQMFSDIVQHCQSQTLLCVAREISTESEMIKTLPISQWKNNKPDLEKRPSIFILGKAQ